MLLTVVGSTHYSMHSENTQKILLTKAKLASDNTVVITQDMETDCTTKVERAQHIVLTVQTPGKTCGQCGHRNHSKYEYKLIFEVLLYMPQVWHRGPHYM